MSLPRGHSRCRACKRVIRWAKTENRRPIPVDPDPVPDGNLVITAQGIAHVLRKNEEPTGLTYVSHFSTCSNRDQFQRRPAPAAAAQTGGR
jgi:hypothetical protein